MWWALSEKRRLVYTFALAECIDTINIMILFLLNSENGDYDFLLPNPPVNGESFLDRFPKANGRFAAMQGLARVRSSDALAVSSSHESRSEAPAFRLGLVHMVELMDVHTCDGR
ncbi:hypothetical protein GF325_09175 [Candidatus Bathyarchaeota archaeon]|nr:hypothetical protein [Candidatus Bathyarchaeota archaeon]